jgi:rod shape-determining protein MreD
VSIYLVIPLLVAVAVVQATFMPHLRIWGVFPDLPLLIVVSWSLLRGGGKGVVWGFIAGIAVDLFSGAPFGAAALALIAVALLSGLGAITVYRTHIALPLLTVFLVTIVYDLIFLLVVRVSGQTVAWLDGLFRVILPSAVLNTVLMPLVFGVMRWLHTRLSSGEMEW